MVRNIVSHFFQKNISFIVRNFKKHMRKTEDFGS